jgi:hypothetical protein
VAYPVIFEGAPFVGEGHLFDLSLTGCSVVTGRTVLEGSYIKLNVFLSRPPLSLLIELGRVRWVRQRTFGVEFIRLPSIARQRLDHEVWERVTASLKASVTTHPLRHDPAPGHPLD